MRNDTLNLSILSLLAVFVSDVNAAQTRDQILASGICEQRSAIERYDQPQSAAGYATIAGRLVITEQTDVIPLRKNIGFGFTWRASGLPLHVDVKYLIEHPPITKPDGQRIDSFEEAMTLESINGVVETTDCYMLSEDHELVPGNWAISIIYNGATLAKRTFRIVGDQ
jgi:hypothetical protein